MNIDTLNNYWYFSDLNTTFQYREMYIGVPGLSQRLFQDILELMAVSTLIFCRYKEDNNIFLGYKE